MKISVSRLKQIIKEELENIAEYERQHEGKSCGSAHPGKDHDEWAKGERSMMAEGDDHMVGCSGIDVKMLLLMNRNRDAFGLKHIGPRDCAGLEVYASGPYMGLSMEEAGPSKKGGSQLAEGEFSYTNEDLEDILEEDEWSFLEEEDFYEG